MQIVSNIQATIVTQIGADQGRNSSVFLAHDPQLNGQIVLKFIPLQLFDSPDQYFRESQILYANKSPRIVPIHYACRDSDFVRVAMPYFPKGSLEDLMNTRFLTVREILRWIDQILTGLHYVHSNSFVHFDIKPSNILLHEDGSAALSDFGQARKTNILGVINDIPPIYGSSMPPEIFSYTSITSLADIYQIGITLYRMCNGNEVFRSQIPSQFVDIKELITNGAFPNRRYFLPHIPRRLKTIIRRLLSVNPMQRYQSIIDIQNDLGQVNTLLDWEYYPSQQKYMWKTRNSIHEYAIEIDVISNTNWCVNGYTTNRLNGNIRRKTAWCKGSFTTRLKALRAVEKIFREMEG